MSQEKTPGAGKKSPKKGRRAPAKPLGIIPPDPERGQGYLNNAEQMLLELFGDVRRIVGDAGLTGGQRISAAEVGLSCCQAMQALKYPPERRSGENGHDYYDCDDPDCEWCRGDGDKEE